MPANVQPDPTEATCEIARANQILRATFCSMHGVANQTEKRHKRFASENRVLLWWLEKSNVKDGKIGLQHFIPNDSYRFVISLCCAEGAKNTAKHGVNVQQSLMYFASFTKTEIRLYVTKKNVFESFWKGEDYIVDIWSKRNIAPSRLLY